MTTTPPTGAVRSRADGRILHITIDNVAKRNAFVPQMMDQLAQALTRYDEDDALWAAVLTAEGEHFTAGLDMPKFFGPTATWKGVPEGNVDPFGMRRRCRKPLITVVQGITYTIGIEMMLAGDIVVAADTARFCQMESRRGIAPLGGAHFRFLSRTGWGNAMYHLMLCDEFDAARALQIGLVQEVVPFGRHVERGLEIARLIAANAPLGIRVMKEAARTYVEGGEAAAIAMLPAIRARVIDTEDAKEGIRSFVERRAAVFQGR
ncbi:MAG: crotonase/enoyl-CoA hydratase family protein [Alphaproteobacteria bacterium]|nr:crotonase/enoyl-CoA hydratase family protein [Alphaproteobacteria bacterium]